jgi:paraquat-inducible protein B
MSKQASKTAIGAFVVGALVLIIITLIVFGKGMFFTKKLKHVLFFEGSVKGLQVGSPVLFRGVPVGQVTDIAVWFRSEDLAFIIPVYVDIDPDKISLPSRVRVSSSDDSILGPLIEKGFKGQLQILSFVTGQLVVNLDFYPEKPPILLGFEKRYAEIPTISNNLDALQKVDIGAIVLKIESAVTSLDQILTSKELRGSIAALEKTLHSLNKFSTHADHNLDMLSNDVSETLVTTRTTMESIDKTVSEYKDLAAQNKYIGYDVHRTLQELQSLSRSLRSLVDYLDRHPEALIRGKSPSKGAVK